MALGKDSVAYKFFLSFLIYKCFYSPQANNFARDKIKRNMHRKSEKFCTSVYAEIMLNCCINWQARNQDFRKKDGG